jgi:YidC/Oxa1 family membrane protein insertase
VLNWLYTAISWILLRWHDAWSFLEGREFLDTNWDWILAIVFLVITVRVILFPLFVKQIKSQRAMQALQPQVKELQQKHKGDRDTLQKELMELYRREKANPLMGCLPIFLQIPVFISLFWILRRLDPSRSDSNIELYTWTAEKFHSASLAKLFGAPIASQFFDDDFGRFAELDSSQTTVRIVTGVLVIIMMVTTHLTAKQMILKTGWATDQTQLMMQRLMVYIFPLGLLISGVFFPLGVIIYWVVQNLFSLGQQQWVLRKYPPPPKAEDATAAARANGSRGGAAGKPAAKQQPARGKAKGAGKGAPVQDEPPAVDGKQLAPRPGAKPVRSKGGSQGGRAQGGRAPGGSQGGRAQGGSSQAATKRTPSQLDKAQAQNIPPKRKSSAPRKG